MFASYAGAPLVAHNGARLGALCLLDTRPRTFSGHDCLILCMLAELAIREMERGWRDANPVSLTRESSKRQHILRACIPGRMLLSSVVGDAAALTHTVCMAAHTPAWSASEAATHPCCVD